MESQMLPLRSFLTRLISAIPPAQDAVSTSNPLKDLGQQDRKLLLTLHVLFPAEFLPALDLLDRGLVTRFALRPDTAPAEEADDAVAPATTVYYVRSAQQSRPNARFHPAESAGPSYEVRLQAWNCSCPAFAFSAFSPTSEDVPEAASEMMRRSTAESAAAGGRKGSAYAACSAIGEDTWLFGGLMRGEGAMPVCKHLLACVLVERCGLFAGFVQEKSAGVAEVAGWAADWGG